MKNRRKKRLIYWKTLLLNLKVKKWEKPENMELLTLIGL